jgi:hypothetical protein
LRSAPGEEYRRENGLALCKFDGRDGPFAIVTPDRNSQTVKLVKPNLLHGPRLSIREDYGVADEFSLNLLEFAENGGGVFVSSWLG